MKAVFFKNAAGFRRWLEKNHGKRDELWVGFYKKDSGRQNMTWSESVDEALCFGWIDGIRKAIDADSYCNRFTPRKPRSNWSRINIDKVKTLIKSGKMRAPGLEAFQKRKPEMPADRQGLEKAERLLLKELRREKKSFEFFRRQTPSYRKNVVLWIAAAKKEETRASRIKKVIAAGRNEARVSW